MALQTVSSRNLWVKWYPDSEAKNGPNPDHHYVPQGQAVSGWIVNYNPEVGATEYTTDKPCGLVKVKLENDEDALLKIPLDRGALVTPFEDLGHRAKPGTYIVLIYVEDRVSKKTGNPYKYFELKFDDDKFRDDIGLQPVAAHQEESYTDLI